MTHNSPWGTVCQSKGAWASLYTQSGSSYNWLCLPMSIVYMRSSSSFASSYLPTVDRYWPWHSCDDWSSNPGAHTHSGLSGKFHSFPTRGLTIVYKSNCIQLPPIQAGKARETRDDLEPKKIILATIHLVSTENNDRAQASKSDPVIKRDPRTRGSSKKKKDRQNNRSEGRLPKDAQDRLWRSICSHEYCSKCL